MNKLRRNIMSISKPIYLLQLSLAVIFLSLTLVNQTRADPIVFFTDGVTSVQLSEDFVAAAGTLDLTPGAFTPATLSDDGVASFPITSGALDLETFIGEISHSGGLILSAADGNHVDLFNFIIDNVGEQLVLTGLGSFNDDIAGRFPLFNLDFANAQVDTSDTELNISGVVLTLTAVGADAHNAAFGVTAFTENFNIATASVNGILLLL